jgi:hypothetical protein
VRRSPDDPDGQKAIEHCVAETPRLDWAVGNAVVNIPAESPAQSPKSAQKKIMVRRSIVGMFDN